MKNPACGAGYIKKRAPPSGITEDGALPVLLFSFAYIHQMIAECVILRIFAQTQRQIEIKISDLFWRIFQKRESRAGESLLTEQRRFFKTEPFEKGL